MIYTVAGKQDVLDIDDYMGYHIKFQLSSLLLKGKIYLIFKVNIKSKSRRVLFSRQKNEKVREVDS